MATPGFHMVFTLENTSHETVEASLVSLMDNPLVPNLDDRMLSNTMSHDGAGTSILLRTDAQPEDRSGIGSICLSVIGGDRSWISGMFQQYAGSLNWNSQRSRAMRVSLLEEVFRSGTLPNTEIARDVSRDFKLGSEEINALSGFQVEDWMRRLSADALVKRIFSDAQTADPQAFHSLDTRKALLKEVARNFAPPAAAATGRAPQRLTWGTGALASTVKLAPGQRAEIRFALS